MRFCPFAERTMLVLLAKKIPFNVINVNLKKKPAWFTGISTCKIFFLFYPKPNLHMLILRNHSLKEPFFPLFYVIEQVSRAGILVFQQYNFHFSCRRFVCICISVHIFYALRIKPILCIILFYLFFTFLPIFIGFHFLPIYLLSLS